jgi:hypothetical protein
MLHVLTDILMNLVGRTPAKTQKVQGVGAWGNHPISLKMVPTPMKLIELATLNAFPLPRIGRKIRKFPEHSHARKTKILRKFGGRK